MSQQDNAAPRTHAHQPGWFDLVSEIVRGMLENAGEQESHAFLRQMGQQLALRYPLAAAQTVQELEVQINLTLSRFNWGFVDLQPQENALLFTHLGLPEGDDSLDAAQWRGALGAVLTGLYAAWLLAQGGSAEVPLVCDASGEDGALRFRYQHIQS